MKLCINCVYHCEDNVDIDDIDGHGYCTHPHSVYDTNIVTGRKSYNRCYVMRRDYCPVGQHICGHDEPTLYREKVSMPRRIVNKITELFGKLMAERRRPEYTVPSVGNLPKY